MNILFDIVQIQNTALKTSYLSFFIGNCVIISCSYKLQQLFVSIVSIQHETFLLHFICTNFDAFSSSVRWPMCTRTRFLVCDNPIGT